MFSKKKKKKKGLRRDPKAFSGRNHKFKRFLRPKTATFFSQKNTLGGKNKSGGEGAKTKIGGQCPPAGNAPGFGSLRVCFHKFCRSKYCQNFDCQNLSKLSVIKNCLTKTKKLLFFLNFFQFLSNYLKFISSFNYVSMKSCDSIFETSVNNNIIAT